MRDFNAMAEKGKAIIPERATIKVRELTSLLSLTREPEGAYNAITTAFYMGAFQGYKQGRLKA